VRSLVSTLSRRVPAIGDDLAMILGVSLSGLLVTAWMASMAPGWVDVLGAWARL
jgi:hypothetical protein